MLFEAEPEHIAALGSTALVRLMKRLMLAESRSVGIALRSNAVPLQVTVPDGGEDGRVEWSGGLGETAYFPDRFTIFQSKAQNLSDSSVKGEVLKKAAKGPARLSPAVEEVLARKGAYVVFCRQPFVTKKREKLVKAIRAAIVEGGGDPKEAAAIEVYDANLISDWVNAHPSVALWLASRRLGRPLGGFLTHEAWGRSPDIYTVPWKPSDEPRFFPVNRSVPTPERKDPARSAWTYEQAAASMLEFIASERSVVRVAGPSGFGKSRFVFEALGSKRGLADEVDTNSVIYADGSISGDEAVKLALELADTALPAVLVIDECTDELHLKLAQRVQRANSRLRLITLDIETKILQAKDTLTIRLERANDDLIKDIAKGISPKLSDGVSSFIAELSEGFPNMAVLAAQQDGDGRQTLESAEHVLDRIIWGSKHPSPEAQRVLEAACLFDWFGLQGRVEPQASFVAAEVAGVSLPVFVEHLLSFKPRGIIAQRGDFVQVGPIPLAARLGLHRLSLMSPDQLFAIFDKAPDELKDGMLKRMRWLDTSPTVLAFAQRLLEPDQLGSLAALNTDLSSRRLDRLVHVNPDAVSSAIDRIVGHLTPDELGSMRDGRRHLVWALEKLVFRKDTFDRSARLLLKLAVAENENYANNATGEFQQLFQLYLSGTEADPAARLLVLDDGLASLDPKEHEICVEALGRMVGTSHFTRSGGSEQIGSGGRLVDWYPKTYGEIRDFYREAIRRLTSLATGNDPLRERAKALLSSHIRGLLHQLPTAEVMAIIETITAHSGFWPEALTGLSHWLYFDQRGAPPGMAKEIRAAFDRLLPTDPVDRAILYTSGWHADLHDPDTQYDKAPDAKHDFEYANRQGAAVAGEIARDKSLVGRAVSRMACSDGKNLFPFAKELARSVGDDVKHVFTLAVSTAEANNEPPNRGFFGGLISGADERDPKLARKLVKSALQSPKLMGDAISLIGSGQLQAEDISLVVSLLKNNAIPAWQCANLSYGRGLDHMQVDEFLPLLEELAHHGTEGLWTILDIVGMYLHGGTRQPTRSLIAFVKEVMLAPDLLTKVRTNMDGYHLHQMIERLASLGAISTAYARKLAKQLLRICKRGTDRVFYELDDPVRQSLGILIGINPTEVWAEIAKKVTSKKWDERFYAENLLEMRHSDDHLERGISFPVPNGLFIDWVRGNPAERAAVAVPWLPVASKQPDGSLAWTREIEEFVKEFADQPGVLAELAGRLHPSSWWGSLAPILEPLIPLLHTWLSHPNAAVRSWAGSRIEQLRKTIEAEAKRSEEDVVRYS